LILHDGTADGASELIAAERGFSTRGIEVAARIEYAVAKEVKGRPMKLVRTRTRDGIDDAAGHAAILRRGIRTDDVELLHRIHAEGKAGHGSWSAVGIVVDVDPVEPVNVLLRPVASDRELRPEAARQLGCSRGRSGELRQNLRN